MAMPILSATVIISVFIAVQCLPDLARVDDYVAEELAPLSDDQPSLHNYYKRDFGLYYKCKYERGKYPHEKDCSKYYDCTTGKEKLVSCPKHQLFDEEKKKCVDSKNAKCKNEGSGGAGSSESEEHHHHGFKCKKDLDGHFPHENDCKKYYACKKGKRKEHTCPKKELYDAGDEKCRPQEDVHCGNKKNPYDPGSETDFKCPKAKGSFAHETDCSKYYSCKYDLARLKSCPKEKLFDVGKGECQNQEDVHCGNKNNPYDPDSKTHFKCPKSKGSFAHVNDCTKYYTCKDDLARLRTCPKKKLFDVGKEECENHEDVHCGKKNNPYEPESKTDFECPKSRGTFAHEGDCSKYYTCKDNLAKLRTCPKNELYDLEAEECENQEEVHCGNKHNPYDISGKKVDFQCPKTVGEFPHEKECNKYYSCKYGLAKMKTCPKKKLFDAEREECRDSKRVHCGKRLDPEGKTFNCPAFSFVRSYPDPSNCKNYYECNFGTPKLKTCPRNERYDAEKKICRNKNKVKCETGSEDEEEEFVCPASKAGNFSVREDCSLYYTCQSRKSHPKSCPPDQLFDVKTAKCQDSQQVNCESRFNPYEDESEVSHEIDYKCPKQEGLYPHEEDCRSYYHCHKGVATIESCPAGKLFDVFKRRCANEKQVNCDDPLDPTTDIHTKYRRHRYRYFWCPRAWGIFYHRSHCGRYYHCWHRRPSIRRCSRGWFFDTFRRRCYEEDFVDCGHRRRRDEDDSKETDDDEFKCPSSRGKYPHEHECSKYYECDRNKATLKTCREGYLFDVRRKQCERHYRVDCGDRIDNEGVVDKNSDFECPTSRGNYPYVEDCSRYFSCTNKKPTLKACPVGQMYDVERGDCDHEQRVDCGGRPKPDGAKQPDEDGFRCPTASGNYPHESDCKKYYSCSNNLVTQKKCRGGQLFDVNRGSCEKADRVDCGDRFDDSSSSSEDSSLENTFRCPTSRGNHPHPDCHMYYSCSNNKFTLKRCPEGQLYDVRRRDCDRWDRVDCGKRKSLFDQSTTVTPSTAQPMISTKSQTSVSKEITSTVDGSKTKLSTVSDKETGYVTKEPSTLSPSGIVDGKTTPAVTRGTQSVTEQPISNIITGSPATIEPSTGTGGDGTRTTCATSRGLFPHEKDCKKYYSCENSIAVLMVCKDPELFDARKSRCTRDVDCGRRIKPGGQNEEKEEPDYRCPSKQGNYPHEDCQWYYVCDRNKHTLKKCPYDKYFDTTKHKCENSDRVDCGGRQLPGSKITNKPTVDEHTTASYKTLEPKNFTSHQVTDITRFGTVNVTGPSTRNPVTGKVINPEGSGATDTYTESPSIDFSSASSIGWPVTGKSTDSNVTNGLPVTNDWTAVTNTHSRRPVTGNEIPISSTDSGTKDVTSAREPFTDSGKTTGHEPFTQTAIRTSVTDKDIGKVIVTHTVQPVTATDSNIGKETSSRLPVTATGSTIDKVTERPITQSRRPITGSTIGEVTGSGRPATDSEIGVVTGSGSPGTRNPEVTSPNIGGVTGSGRPGTGSEIGVVTGSGSPGTRNPEVTSSNIGGVTGSGRPGTGSEIGVVTGSGSPGTRIPEVTSSNIGGVTGSGRPGTDSEIGVVTGSSSPATGTRNPLVTTATGSSQPATDSNIGVTSSSSKGITDQGTHSTTASTGYPNICTTRPSTDGGICEEDFVCPTATGYYPYDKDCKKYYKCTASVPKLMTCSGGRKFDATSNTCISKKVDCGSRYDPDGSGESHERKHDCPTSREGHYPNKNCEQYIICNKKKYQTKRCPFGELYDASKKKCEASHLVDCGGRRDPYGESTTATVSITREGGHGISSSSTPVGSGNTTQDVTSTSPSVNNITTINKTTSDVNVDQNRSTEITRNEFNITADVTTVSLPVSKSNIIDNSSLTTSEVPTGITKDAKEGLTPDVSKETKGITENPLSVAVENSTIGFKITTTGRPFTANVTGKPPISNSTIIYNRSSTKPEVETEAITNVTERPTPDIGKIIKTATESQPPSTVKVVTGAITTTSTAATRSKSTTSREATISSHSTTTKPSPITEKPEGILYCPEPNGLFPHPDPHKFVHCSNWEPHIKDCPGNLVFNRKLKVCSWTLSFAQDIPTM